MNNLGFSQPLSPTIASKYCPLLAEDNGIDILTELSMNESTPDYIRHLSSLTLYQYDLYLKEGNLTELEESTDIEIPSEFLSKHLKRSSIDDS